MLCSTVAQTQPEGWNLAQRNFEPDVANSHLGGGNVGLSLFSQCGGTETKYPTFMQPLQPPGYYINQHYHFCLLPPDASQNRVAACPHCVRNLILPVHARHALRTFRQGVPRF